MPHPKASQHTEIRATVGPTVSSAELGRRASFKSARARTLLLRSHRAPGRSAALIVA